MMEEGGRDSLDAKVWMVLLSILLIFTAVIIYARHVTLERQSAAESNLVSRYTNYQYDIKLRFPPGWVPARGYAYERYEGPDGFFGLSAVGGEGLSIDEAAENEASHKLKPYGSSPQVESLVIDGQEGRLILPSEDQSPSMDGQAALIVEYPEPVELGGDSYRYFVLWADEGHIHFIASTLEFVREDD